MDVLAVTLLAGSHVSVSTDESALVVRNSELAMRDTFEVGTNGVTRIRFFEDDDDMSVIRIDYGRNFHLFGEVGWKAAWLPIEKG